MEFLRKNKKTIAKLIIAVILIGILWKFYAYYSCPFRLLFGFSCPGCGVTRAFEALVCFDFERAFYYNPTVFLLPVMFPIILFHKKLPRRLFYSAITIFFVLMIAIYVFRIVTGNEIVSFDFESGLIYKFFNK